jgi:hypothetical protein
VADRSLALSVSVMLEGWTDGAAPEIGPMSNPLRSGVLDLQGRSLLASVVGPVIVSYFVARNIGTAFIVFAVAAFAAGSVVLFFAPETTNRSLEDISP